MALLLPPASNTNKKIGVNSSAITIKSSFSNKIRSSEKKISASSLIKKDKETSSIIKKFDSSNSSLQRIINVIQKEQKEDIQEYRKEKSEKQKEKDKKKKEETEKFLESKTGIAFPKISGIKLPSIQAPGFFQRFIDAVTWLTLGWIVDKLISNESFLNGAINLGKKLGEFLTTVLPPFMEGVFKFIEIASPFVLTVGSFAIDTLFWAIDTADSSYNAIRQFTKDKFGEEGLKKLDDFTAILNKFIDGIIIFATASSLVGGDGPSRPSGDRSGPRKPPRTAPVGGTRAGALSPGSISGSRTPSAISRYLSRDPLALRALRQYGVEGQAVFENALSKALADGKTPTQARITAQNSLDRLVKQGKLTPKPLPGLSGPGQTPGAVLKGGFQRSFNRFGLKVLGRNGLQAVKQFAGRVPIAGPIISGVASLLAGEPISQALVKASGSAIGGFIGGGLTGPLAPVGVIVGSLLGEFLANTLYEIVTGEADQKIRSVATAALKTAGMQLSGDLKKITDGIVGFFSFIKDPSKITKVLGDVIVRVGKSIGDLIGFLLNIVKKIPGGMQAIRAIAGIGSLAQNAAQTTGKLGTQALQSITSPLRSAAAAITSTASQLAKGSSGFVSQQIDRAKAAFSPVASFLGDVKRGADAKLAQAAEFVTEKFKKVAEFGGRIQQKSLELGQNIKGFAGTISEGAKNMLLNRIINPIKDKLRPLIDKVKGMGDKIKKFITENPFAKKISSALEKKGVKGFGDMPGIMKAVGAKGLTAIGGLFNLLFASDRLKSGDTSGGILEGLSGVLDLSTLFGFVPGSPLSLVIDAYLLARDLVPEIMNEEKFLFSKVPGFSSAEPTIKQLSQNLPSFNSILSMFGQKKPQGKNEGGIVGGYNSGGIVGGYNAGGMVGSDMIKPPLPTSSKSIRPSKKLNKVNMVRYSTSRSSRYDISQFNRSMEYEQGYIEHTKVVVLVKPVVAV